MKLAYTAKKFENFLKKNFGGFHYDTIIVDKENTRTYRLYFGNPERFSYTEFWDKGGSGGNSFIEDLIIDGQSFSFEEHNINTIEDLVSYFCKTYNLEDTYSKNSRSKASDAAPVNPEAIPATAIKNLTTLKSAMNILGDSFEDKISKAEIPLNPLTLQVILNSAVSKVYIEDNDYYGYLDEINASAALISENVKKFSELKSLAIEDYKKAIEWLNSKNLW
jgi:hypothetical protein